MNLNGGLRSNLSTIFGLSIRAPTRRVVVATKSSPPWPGGKAIGGRLGRRGPNKDAPPEGEEAAAGRGAEAAAAAAAGGAAAAAAAFGFSWPGLAPESTPATISAMLMLAALAAHSASPCSSAFVFSGSTPVMILAGLTSMLLPMESSTAACRRDRKASFCSFSFTFSLFNWSSANKPAPNPVWLSTAVTMSCRKRKGGFCSSAGLSVGFTTKGCRICAVTSQ
jgi:hypothetical protein